MFLRVLITDAARLLEDPILNLCPGMKYPISCQQRGQSGTNNTVTDPVFAVRNGDNGQIDIIRSDDSGYNVFAGNLEIRSGFPHKKFYLIIDEITLEDNDKQFTCLNEEDVDYVNDYFFGDHTTIFVPSDEGKEIKPYRL